MTERQLWYALRSSSVFDWAMRIESPSTPGCPDVFYSIDGKTGWIELKSVQKPQGVRARPLLSRMQPSQYAWHATAAQHGVRAFILLMLADRALLLAGSRVAYWANCTAPELLQQALWIGGTTPSTRFEGLRMKLRDTDGAFPMATTRTP
jgi:hypothetical protein